MTHEELMHAVKCLHINDGDVVVLRGCSVSFAKQLNRMIHDIGHADVMVLHLVPDASLELLDTVKMREAGWIREKNAASDYTDNIVHCYRHHHGGSL